MMMRGFSASSSPSAFHSHGTNPKGTLDLVGERVRREHRHSNCGNEPRSKVCIRSWRHDCRNLRSFVMPVHRRLEVSEVGSVTVVRFVDRKILDAANIQELGDELFGLVEQDNRKNILLNFSNVEFMSSAALNKLIVLNKKVQGVGGKLRLSNLRPEIYDVFVITRLNTVFDIKSDEADALAAFGG
jgi:anti-sigma B factor antagonist